MQNDTIIKIERFSKEDFSRLISWIDREETLVQFAGPIFSFPLTNEQLEDYLTDPMRNAFKIINTADNSVIGHAEIYLLKADVAKLCRILIGEKTDRGKGLGQKIVSELLKISFIELGKSSVELNVYDWNISAIKCYEKMGFSTNKGVTKTTVVNGKKWLSLNMTTNKTVWESLVK
jgi:RimJ/RimL family protein N-acetyltransferase